MPLDQYQCLHLWRLILYLLEVILSFFCFIPHSVSLAAHGGYCLLYADVGGYGSVANCGYCVAVPIIFCLIYGGTMSFFSCWDLMGYKAELGEMLVVLGFLAAVALDCISFFLMLINSCLSTVGLREFCVNIFDNTGRCSQGYLVHPIFGRDTDFYIRLKMSEVCSWLAWVFWLFQMVTSLTVLYVRREKVAAKLRGRCFDCGNPWDVLCPCLKCRCRLQFQEDDDEEPDKNQQVPSPDKNVADREAV